MTEYQKVPLKSIKVLADRGRKSFTQIPDLAESIKKNGLIHPILCKPDPDSPGTYILVAGERRYRASALAGLMEVPITFKEMSPLEAKVIELEENVFREDLSWPEECELNRQIHELKVTQDGSWQKQQTAELMQISPATLSNQIQMAEKLKADPSLKNLVKNLPFHAAKKVIEQKEQVDKSKRLQASGKLVVTTDLLLGSCLVHLPKLADNSVDLVVTDPPYGIEELEHQRSRDFSTFKGNSAPRVGYALMSQSHNMTLEEVLVMLRKLAPELYRVMKPGAHFYMFSEFESIGKFVEALKPLEFKPPVLVWDRGKPTAPGYGYGYLNSTEAVIFGFKPPMTRRLLKNMYNVIQHPEVPRNLRVYPTEKPQGLLRTFIEQSSNVGELVFDPFAGSGSTLKAARSLNRKSLGCEINEESWNRTQLQLSEGAGKEELFALNPTRNREVST